jgi:hypothetical protein
MHENAHEDSVPLSVAGVDPRELDGPGAPSPHSQMPPRAPRR